MNISRSSRRYLKLLISLLIILLVLMVIINLGLREIVKSGFVDKKIDSIVTKKTNSDLKYEKIKVNLVPSPHIKIYKGKFRHNNNFVITCNFESVEIYPKLIPLLVGAFKVKYITVNKPVALIDLPKRDPISQKEKNNSSSIVDYFENYYKYLIELSSKLPEINLQINNGELSLNEESKEVLQLKKVETEYEFSDKLKFIKFSTNSNFASTVKFEGKISPEDHKSSFALNFKTLEPDKLSKITISELPYITENSKIDLDIKLNFDGGRKISGDIRSHRFSLNLNNKGNPFSFTGKNLYGDFKIDDEKELYSIKKADLENPDLNLSGKFQNDKIKQIYNLKISGEEVDIKSTGEMALFSLNRFKITEKIFQVLKTGKFKTIEFSSKSEKLNKLFKDSNYYIKGKMKDGDIYVPHIDFNFNNVNGQASIKKGVLNGKNLKGEMGSSIIRDGTLTLGFGKDNDILKINADIDGNLSEITPHLKRLIKNEKFLMFLSSLENLNGNASGNLVLGDEKSSLKAKVKVNKFNLSVNYPKIPYEINLSGSDLDYEKSNINFKNVKGNISETKFTELTGKYDWADESDLEISNLNSEISIKELNNWISQYSKYSGYLEKYNSAKGNISVRDLHFSRLISDREKWNLSFTSEGEIHDKDNLKYSLNFSKTPGEIVIENLKIKDRKSDAEISLNINDEYYKISYSGILAEETTNNIHSDNRFSFGLLEGDININYLKDQVSESTANGKLKGEKIVIPFKGDNTINIESFNLNAVNNKINFESLKFLLKNIGLDLIGTLYSNSDKLIFDLKRGTACDVITFGNFAIDNKNLEMNIDASSENKKIDETLNCFFNNSERISGNYDLQAQINGNGNKSDIKKILNGEFTLNIKDGKVPNNHHILTAILKVTNITQIYKGKLPDFSSEGLKFSKIDINGVVEDGVIRFKDATFDSPYIQMLFGGYVDLNNDEYNIKFNVAVLQVVHDVLKKIPLIKKLKAQNLISIPVRVKGKFNEPDSLESFKE